MGTAAASSLRPREIPFSAVLLVSVLLHAGLFALPRSTPPHASTVSAPVLRVTLSPRVETPAATAHGVAPFQVHAVAGPVRAQASAGPTRKVAIVDRPPLHPQLPTTDALPREAAVTVAPLPLQPVATEHRARSAWGARPPPGPFSPQAQDGQAAMSRTMLQVARDAVRASLSSALRELAAAGDGSCEVAMNDDAAAFESTCDSGALAQAFGALSEPARLSVTGGMRAIGLRRLGISIAAGQLDIALR